MTLRRKMALQIATMIVGLLLVSGAALWGMRGLRQDYGATVRGYESLREVYTLGSHLETAKTLLTIPTPDRPRAAAEVSTAAARFALMTKDRAGDPNPHEQALATKLRDASDRLRAAPNSPDTPATADVAAVNAALAPLGDLAAGIRRDIESSEQTAERRLHMTTLATAAVCGVVILGAVLLGVWQYGGVMRPLHRIGAGVRRVASGALGERIEPRPRDAEEFRTLAADFNRMAGELDSFTRELEEKVAAKSKELTRSERLASVGYLAAGVAHEINNPLGIITGHAELAMEGLKQKYAGDADASLSQTLRVICDEAYRVKDITGKLLSLARQGEEARASVDLAGVARQVAAAVTGLRQFEGRKLSVNAPDGEAVYVHAVEAEMRQVVMNLVINALEAVDEHSGGVIVRVTRNGDAAELTVTDNGRGMTAQAIERAFEPFYTEKRGRQHGGGTGLGLSITHAIVESHGGRISATSDGPGRGSRFVVRLPILQMTNG